MIPKKIGVLGAGSWGTTLANLLAAKGYDVLLWSYEPDLAQRMTESRENDLYLPDFELAPNLKYTSELETFAVGRDMLVLVPPSQIMRALMEKIAHVLEKATVIVAASKGIENGTLLPLSAVLQDILPDHPEDLRAFLSGPSFAREVAAGMPTAVTAASTSEKTARLVQETFSTDQFRVYTNDDVVGVELGGALKNVIAIATGVVDGLGFGYNTRAALITRGLAEISRMGEAMGARAGTFAGLAGMGDLVLTCTGDLSRNRTVGVELGRGHRLDDILGGMKTVAEGVKTTLSAYQLAIKLGVDMPITEQVYLVLYEGKDPKQAVIDLMQRELKPEQY